MFCPKCARPLAGEVQFCQQCGMALEGVRSLVEADGQGVVVKEKARGVSARRKGYRRGFVLMLVALLALCFYPVVEGLLQSLIPSVENSRLDELPLELFGTVLFVLFAAGLARVLYARLFESAEAAEVFEDASVSRLAGATAAGELPPSRGIPVDEFFAGRVNTAELAARPSVTEHTTRSLHTD